jgi:putative membrane protein
VRIVVWLFRALIFFALFAFALNNQHDATLHSFFGYTWTAPMAIVVLIAFAVGCMFGVLAMVPSWWRQRRVARRHAPPAPEDTALPTTLTPAAATAGEPSLPPPTHPPRDGL